jgi:CubicO group peptidase (beta-lactamase class C family)
MQLHTTNALWRLAACTLFLATTASGQKVHAIPDAAKQVGKIFSEFDRPDSPGCAVGAEIDGQNVLTAAYGIADLEHNVKIAPDTIFEVGSVTKQFTATSVLLLAQKGKLSLDDPVRKYIPELPDYGTPITIRHMLHHTSGLRDWGIVAGIGGWPRTTRVYTLAHLLDIVSRQRALNFPPGADYSYTNTGFNLASIIVARVSGETYPKFTHDEIFVPLDMTSTSWRDDFQRVVPNRAIAYSREGGTTKMLMPFENVIGQGGMLSTVGDLLRWNRNFASGKVGGKSLIDSLEEHGKLNDGRTIGYATGLEVLERRGVREVSHNGITAGYRAWLGRYPDQGLSIAVLCNMANVNPVQLGHRVADVYLNGVLPMKTKPAFIHLDAASLQSKAGLYRSVRDHEAILMEVDGEGLRIDRHSGFRPVSPVLFATDEEGTRLEFKLDTSGHIAGLRLVTDLDENNIYERVEPAHPDNAQLQAMAGDYSSDEAEVEYRVALENGKLVMHRRPDAVIPLTPTYRDGFNSSLGSVRFIRNAAGRVSEMSIGAVRVWDLRLKRVN